MTETLKHSPQKTAEKKELDSRINQLIHGILNPEIITKISLDEAKIIADWIIEENKIKKHMIEKTPLQIMQEINSGLGVVAKINSEIVGSMSMIKITLPNKKVMYEAGSLITSPEKRGHGIAKILSKEIFLQNMDKAVYSITEVKGVMHIYNDILKLHNFSKFDLDTEVLAEIESVGALLETDIIYGNKNFLELNK